MANDNQKDNNSKTPSLEDSQGSHVSAGSSTKDSVLEDKQTESVESSSLETSSENEVKKDDLIEPKASTEGLQAQADSPDQVAESSSQTSDQVAKTQEQTEAESSDLMDEGATISEAEEIIEETLPELYLNGFYAIKLGMSSIYNDQGQIVPVTVLRFDTWKVTQIKTKDRDGYVAIQLGSGPKSEKKSNLPQKGHLKPSGFPTNVTFLREIRGEVPHQPSKDSEKEASATSQDTKDGKSINCQLGQVLSIHSLAKGDRVHLSSISKGRGFAGTIKRLGYSGGPASHGSQFHRKPGSIGMCEEPARVLPGKGMPGHHGNRNVTLKHVEIVDVISAKKVLLVKGSVPGGRNSLVKLMKESV